MAIADGPRFSAAIAKLMVRPRRLFPGRRLVRLIVAPCADEFASGRSALVDQPARDLAHVVALAQLDTGVTQDVVSGDDMKIEVWD